jgi:hypothetical protein
MKKDNIVHMKIEFEHIPILDRSFMGLKAAEDAWEKVRKKLR